MSKAKAQVATVPKKQVLDRKQVDELIGELRKLSNKFLTTNRDGDNPRRDANSYLTNLRKLMLAASDKRLLDQFKRNVCSKLRATPENQRPEFTRVRFYLWVVENVPKANELLPLLDDVELCPDSWMRTVRDSYKRKPKKD